MQAPNADTRRFADISLDDEARFTCTITPAMVDAFAELSGDFNPLHTSEEYAATTPFRHRVAHGMIVGSLFSRLIGMHLPGLYCVYLSQSIKFKNPIYLGTTVEVRGIILAKSEASHTLTLMLSATDTKSAKVVAEGEALVQVTQ